MHVKFESNIFKIKRLTPIFCLSRWYKISISKMFEILKSSSLEEGLKIHNVSMYFQKMCLGGPEFISENLWALMWFLNVWLSALRFYIVIFGQSASPISSKSSVLRQFFVCQGGTKSPFQKCLKSWNLAQIFRFLAEFLHVTHKNTKVTNAV